MAEYPDLKKMVMTLRVSELQLFLQYAGRNKNGRKNDLLSRALNVVHKECPLPVTMKLRELYNTVVQPRGRYPLTGSAGINPMGSASSYQLNSKDADPKRALTVLPPHPFVKFKKLPFYDHLAELVKVTSLAPRLNTRFQESNFVFHLTAQQAQEIAMSRYYKPGEFMVQIQLRFCVLDLSSEQSDTFPPNICVRVNGKMAPLPNPIPSNKPGVEPKRPGKPLDITPNCRISPTLANHVDVSWSTDLTRSYCCTITLVKKLSSEILLQRLKETGIRRADESQSLIKEKLSHADTDIEVAATSLRASLLCPLGKMRMQIPCRSDTCKHLQCFDAATFLMMNEKRPTWLCPVCDKPALFNTLIIDGLFVDILEQAKDCIEVKFAQDSSWVPVIPENEPLVIASPVVPSSKPRVSPAMLPPELPDPIESPVKVELPTEVVDLTCESSDEEDYHYDSRPGTPIQDEHSPSKIMRNGPSPFAGRPSPVNSPILPPPLPPRAHQSPVRSPVSAPPLPPAAHQAPAPPLPPMPPLPPPPLPPPPPTKSPQPPPPPRQSSNSSTTNNFIASRNSSASTTSLNNSNVNVIPSSASQNNNHMNNFQRFLPLVSVAGAYGTVSNNNSSMSNSGVPRPPLVTNSGAGGSHAGSNRTNNTVLNLRTQTSSSTGHIGSMNNQQNSLPSRNSYPNLNMASSIGSMPTLSPSTLNVNIMHALNNSENSANTNHVANNLNSTNQVNIDSMLETLSEMANVVTPTSAHSISLSNLASTVTTSSNTRGNITSLNSSALFSSGVLPGFKQLINSNTSQTGSHQYNARPRGGATMQGNNSNNINSQSLSSSFSSSMPALNHLHHGVSYSTGPATVTSAYNNIPHFPHTLASQQQQQQQFVQLNIPQTSPLMPSISPSPTHSAQAMYDMDLFSFLNAENVALNGELFNNPASQSAMNSNGQIHNLSFKNMGPQDIISLD